MYVAQSITNCLLFYIFEIYIYTDNIYTSIYRAQYDMQLIGVYKTFIKSSKYVIRKEFRSKFIRFLI